MKSALSRYRGPLLQSREEVQEVMASFMDRHSAPITTKRPREVSPTDGDRGSGALGCKIDPSQVLRALQELHKACSKMQTKYSESMGLEAYEQWVEELLGLIQLYMGDDWPDLPMMKQAGLRVCPAQGHEAVREFAHFVTSKAGGYGAVRELCDLILKAQNRYEALLMQARN